MGGGEVGMVGGGGGVEGREEGHGAYMQTATQRTSWNKQRRRKKRRRHGRMHLIRRIRLDRSKCSLFFASASSSSSSPSSSPLIVIISIILFHFVCFGFVWPCHSSFDCPDSVRILLGFCSDSGPLPHQQDWEWFQTTGNAARCKQLPQLGNGADIIGRLRQHRLLEI